MKRSLIAVAALLLGSFAAQCVAFVRANGQMYDEALNLAAGVLFLRNSKVDVNPEHPPLAKALAALPVVALESPAVDVDAWRADRDTFALGRRFLYEGGVPHARLLLLGRLPMVALAVALVALTGAWALRLFGPGAALLALALAAFDPNLVAHGSIIGHDAPLALFATLAFFALGEHFERPHAKWLALAGVATGLALVTKFTGLIVLAAALASIASRALAGAVLEHRVRAVVTSARSAAIVAGVAFVVVGIFYASHGYLAYARGVYAQVHHQAAGHRAFFLGEVSSSGWAMYMPVALALKVPPLTVALFAVSLAVPRRGARLDRAMHVAVVPLAAMFVAFASIRVDIGVRYAAPLFPLLIVLASRVATMAPPLPRPGALALAVGLGHHAIAAVRVAPHDVAFFSDAVGGPARGHLYLSDSNLDWGQDVQALGEWNKRTRPRRLYLSYFGTASPEAYGVEGYQPAPNGCGNPSPPRGGVGGTGEGGEFLAVSEMNEQGVLFEDPRAYAWLRTRSPVASLGHSIDVFDITKDAGAHRALAALYTRYGPAALAPAELARAGAIESGAR